MNQNTMKIKAIVLGSITFMVLLGAWFTYSYAAEDPKVPTAETEKPKEQQIDDDGDGKPKALLRDFMRQKLLASNMILEGLATEDMSLVKQGATQLNKMSQVEQWRVHNDVMYKQFSGEFQRVTQALKRAAEDDNIDQAALQWMGATMTCIECHRYVRNELVVEAK